MDDEKMLSTKNQVEDFVTEDIKMLEQTKHQLVEIELTKFVETMQSLRVSAQQIDLCLKNYLK